MIAQENQPATPEDKVLHSAMEWRQTEKVAISASSKQKPEAQRLHYRAKMKLREAVDLILRRQP